MRQLLDLPSELIASIAQHLDNESFFATRLANRSLESASVTPFGRRFFRKKGYMLTTPSLDVLQSVADSSKLRKYVQHVWFNPDCYTYIVPMCAPDDDIECDDAENESEDERIEVVQRVDLLSDEDRRRWFAYYEVMEDHQRLLEEDASMLQCRLESILPHLPNVKILGMRRSEDHSPWGWWTLREAIGEDPRVLGPIPTQPIPSLSDSTKLFKAMISAVASCGLKLQRLYTDAVEIDNMPTDWLQQPTLHSALQSMLYLEINLSKANLPPSSTKHYRVLQDISNCGDGLLKVFREAAPTLLELGLQIFPKLRQAGLVVGMETYGSEVFEHSNQYVSFRKIVENVQFEHLTRLKLEKIVTTSALLEAFLSPSKDGLTSLKMRDIRLLSDAENRRPWEHIFSFLLASVPRLEYLLLYQLLYTYGGVCFVESLPQTSQRTVNGGNSTNPGLIVNTTGELNAREDISGPGGFREYQDITVEAKGRAHVERTMAEVRDRHWYCGNVYSYAMDDEVWHTDTSDEEW